MNRRGIGVAALLLASGCCRWSASELAWQVGDEEELSDVTEQLGPYPDELNYTGELGDFPEFPDPFVVGQHAARQFPWNANSAEDYAADFTIEWEGTVRGGGVLTVSWSPGHTGHEIMVLTLLDTDDSDVFEEWGDRDDDGWRDYPLVTSRLEIPALDAGWHSLRVEHTSGNGSIFDWLRLEAECAASHE